MDDDALTCGPIIRKQSGDKVAKRRPVKREQERGRQNMLSCAKYREASGFRRGGAREARLQKPRPAGTRPARLLHSCGLLSAVSCWLGPSNPLNNEPNPDTLSSRQFRRRVKLSRLSGTSAAGPVAHKWRSSIAMKRLGIL